MRPRGSSDDDAGNALQEYYGTVLLVNLVNPVTILYMWLCRAS
jgi:hypothetical protein